MRERDDVHPDAGAERRQQELLARYRLRIARVASTIALIVIAAIAFHLVVHMEPYPPAALWVLLATGAVISAAIRVRTGPGAAPLPLWAFYVWTAAVLAFDSAVVYLCADASSDIYLAYLLAVLFAAATLPAWGAALALVAAVIAYVAVVLMLGGDIARPELVMRAATFTVVGLLGAYISREQQREIAQRVEQEERAQVLARGRGELLAKAISAQEGERVRIARELHDGPVQELSSVSMQLGLVQEMTPDEYAESQPRIAEARAVLRRTLADVRRMIQDLRPSALDDLGLITAVHDLAAAQCEAHSVGLRWDVTGPARRLAPAVETAVFRIVQEGVNNVVRHARARSARVSLAFVDGHLRASVEDDGVGFDPSAVRRSRDGNGVGLLGMQERAALLGGAVQVASRPGHGTRVTAEIPLRGAIDA